MPEKRRMIRNIVDRLFPELARLDDRLKPITNPETTSEMKTRLVHDLLKQETPNLDTLLCDRARRRRERRGRFLEMGIGDWRIYDNDVNILHNTIKLREYIIFRLIIMESLRFGRRCVKLDERQAPLDKAKFDRIDATRFFSFPPAVMTTADWDYWLRLATLTEEESVALSLGKNPDVISLASLDEERANDKRSSPFFDEYQLRLRAIQRASVSGAFGGSLTVKKFLAWARANKFDVPIQLRGALPAPPGSIELVEDMNPKSRKTLRLLLLFMAVNKFGHKLDGNSTAITNIVDRLAEHGIKIDRGAVRDLLTDAAADHALADEVKLLRKYARSS